MRRLALLVSLVACGGSGGGYSGTPTAPQTPSTPTPATVASVTVTGSSGPLAIGATQQLTATTKDAAGNILTGRTISWSTSSAAIVSVSSTGLATAVASGTATITATSEQQSGNVPVTVSAAAADNPFTILGTILTPTDFGVAAGLPVADATGIVLSDGRVRLYVFAQNQGTRSAISTSAAGTAFTAEPGLRNTAGGWGQTRIIKLSDGRVRIYYGAERGIQSAISTDGLTFTDEPGLRLSSAALGYDVACMTIVPVASGGYRAYFSNAEKPGEIAVNFISSAVSTDLLNWTVEPGIVIGGPTGPVSGASKHPFARVNPNGSVTLYYQGQRTINGSQYFGLFRTTSTDGRTFTSEENLGIQRGADPDFVTLNDGTIMMYYGDFDPVIGGYIRAAKQIR